MAERLLPGLERRLKAEVSGGVDFGRFTRGRYATDASHYQIMPLGVVTPRTIEEAERAIAICRAEGVPVTAARRRHVAVRADRQSLGRRRLLEASQPHSRSRRRRPPLRASSPASCSTISTAQLKPHGLWFPVDVSTASRATIGGMTANNSCGGRSLRYGNTRENVISIDAHAGRRQRRRISVRWRPICPTCRRTRRCVRWRAICSRSARARPTRSRRAFPRCSAGSAATISTRWCRAATTSTSRISWSAPKARSAFSTAIELKLSPVLGRRAVGACHFGSFHEAMDAAQHIVKLAPIAVELVDAR